MAKATSAVKKVVVPPIISLKETGMKARAATPLTVPIPNTAASRNTCAFENSSIAVVKN
jgi:hypothetical protein